MMTTTNKITIITSFLVKLQGIPHKTGRLADFFPDSLSKIQCYLFLPKEKRDL